MNIEYRWRLRAAASMLMIGTPSNFTAQSSCGGMLAFRERELYAFPRPTDRVTPLCSLRA